MSDPEDDGEPRHDLDDSLSQLGDTRELDAIDDDQHASSEEQEPRASTTSSYDQTTFDTDYHDQRGVFSPDISTRNGAYDSKIAMKRFNSCC